MKRVSELDRKYLPDIYDEVVGHEQMVRESQQFYIDSVISGHPFILLLSRHMPGDPKTVGYSVEDVRFARVSLVKESENKHMYRDALVVTLEQVIEVSIGKDFLLEMDSTLSLKRDIIVEYFSRFPGFKGIATHETWQNPEK